MANFKRQSKRLLSVALALIMVLSAIPFVSLAADEAPAPEYVYFGTYTEKPLKWLVLSKENGKLLLVTDGVIYKPTKYHSSNTAVAKFEDSALYTTLNGSVHDELFNVDERTKLCDLTVSYGVWESSTTRVTKTVTAKVLIPSQAIYNTYSTYFATKTYLDRTTSATNYWLADASANTKTNKNFMTVTGSNGNANVNGVPNNNNTFGIRPMILVDAAGFVTFTAVDGVTYTNAYGDAIENATLALAAQFKVVLEDKYNKSDITVKANGTALTAADGVYTLPAGEADVTVTVEGVELNPGDFTAYNQAREAALALNEADYTATSWAALAAALAVDVSACMGDEQTRIDDAAAAINSAIAQLVEAADFTAFDAAWDKAAEISRNTPVAEYHNTAPYNLNEKHNVVEDETPAIVLENLNDIYFNYGDAISCTCGGFLSYIIKTYPSATVHKYTAADQDKVDEATAALEWAISIVPYVTANANTWQELVNEAENLNANIYMNVPDYQARVAAIVAEHDYIEDRVDITHQAEVDASAERIRDIINECKADSNWIPADYTELDRLIELADTYLEENYYKDEDVKKGRSNGGTAAWEEFARARDAAKAIDRELNNTRYNHQATIDALAQDLSNRMEILDPYVRLSSFMRFIADARADLAEFGAKVSDIAKLIKGVFDLLGSLFKGEIDIYSILDLAGVDNPKLIAFLEKLGFKHIDVTVEPTDPQN